MQLAHTQRPVYIFTYRSAPFAPDALSAYLNWPSGRQRSMEFTRVVPFNSGTNEFCIGRMVTKFGLLTLGATRGLRAAKARIKELTESSPGNYVVFLRNTGRVVARASSEFQ